MGVQLAPGGMEGLHRTGHPCKKWDPVEEMILLIGSVLEINSLGKWIYNWSRLDEGPTSRSFPSEFAASMYFDWRNYSAQLRLLVLHPLGHQAEDSDR